MIWDTLNNVRNATKIKFVPGLAAKHTFVKLESGNWCRVLGEPCSKHTKHIKGKVYHATGYCSVECYY